MRLSVGGDYCPATCASTQITGCDSVNYRTSSSFMTTRATAGLALSTRFQIKMIMWLRQGHY